MGAFGRANSYDSILCGAEMMMIPSRLWWKLDHEKVIPGSMRASIGEVGYKVKEKLKGVWREGKLVKFIVVGFSIEGTHRQAPGVPNEIKIAFDVDANR